MSFEYEKLCEIDKDIERTNDLLVKIKKLLCDGRAAAIPPYMNLTDMDGRSVTVFLQGIVMIAPGTNHAGAYIQLNLGGISTQESYEIVKGRLRRLEELAIEEKRDE